MSTEDSSDGPAARLVDTVTPSYFGRPDAEMHAVGLLLGALVVVLLVPLLPFIVVLWVVSRLTDRRRAGRTQRLDRPRERTPPS